MRALISLSGPTAHPRQRGTHSPAHTRTTKTQVLLNGTIGDVKDLDIAKWAGWLADNGYDNKEGWAKIEEGVRAK